MKKYQDLSCILLIDDDPATNFVNKMIIERAQVDTEIVVCSGGQEALDYLSCEGTYASATDDPQPGIIFLDINMPGMNGWEFLVHYEKMPDEQKARIVVAMLTTSLNPEDKKTGEENKEVETFMHKPLKQEMLFELIDANFKPL